MSALKNRFSCVTGADFGRSIAWSRATPNKVREQIGAALTALEAEAARDKRLGRAGARRWLCGDFILRCGWALRFREDMRRFEWRRAGRPMLYGRLPPGIPREECAWLACWALVQHDADLRGWLALFAESARNLNAQEEASP